ncbi:MAG: PAS domain-containing protein [Burkholderiales bacterium]|nr:PAS domain-containing protein [Burkholderiales bacterium]
MSEASPDIASVLAVLETRRDDLRIAQELIEVLPIPVFFKGCDGKYLGVNRAWEAFFGVKRATILGGRVTDLYPNAPGVAARHREMDDQLWANPGDQSYEIQLTMPDGRVHHTIYYKATYRGADGEVAGLIGTIVDITERKQAGQREAIEHAVARHLGSDESLGDAIRGIMQVMCEKLDWACAARWSLDETQNRLHCVETWSVDDDRIRAFLEMSRRETFVPGTTGMIRRVLTSGESVWVADVTEKKDFLRAPMAAEAGLKGAFALPVRMGDKVLGAIEFFSREPRHPDTWLLQITVSIGNLIGQLMARRQAEAAMRRAYEELEIKARELTRSNEELQQFAYVASHDLQEPLRMISSYTQLLGRRYGETFDGDAREFMAYIVDGAARMKQLIEDLLAYSRVGTRGRDFQKIDGAASLARALANLRGSIEASAAKVTHDAMPPEVVADGAQLAQVFQNLIGNAIKFRGEEPPRIHVGAETREEAWVFTVKDNGIGLDTQYADRIFMMFQRLHNKAEYPGTGIGLAIVKKIVERHGGRIWVESQPGQGCNFGFTIAREHGAPP